MNKTIGELFAGVGGFRLGFERADVYKRQLFQVHDHFHNFDKLYKGY